VPFILVDDEDREVGYDLRNETIDLVPRPTEMVTECSRIVLFVVDTESEFSHEISTSVGRHDGNSKINDQDCKVGFQRIPLMKPQ